MMRPKPWMKPMPAAMPAKFAPPWPRSTPPCVAKRWKHRLHKWHPPQLLWPRLLMPPVNKLRPWQKRTLRQMQQPMPLKPALKALMLPRPKRLRPQWPRPNPPSLLWRCVAMTVLAKRKQKLRQVAMAAVMADPVSAARVPVGTVVPVARVIEAVTASVTAVHVVMSAKTVGLAWAMRLSVRNEKPWSVPKCLCANWPHKPTAKR